MFRRCLYSNVTLWVKSKPSWTNHYQTIQHTTFCSAAEKSKEIELWLTKTLIKKENPSISVNEWYKSEDQLKKLSSKHELNFTDKEYRKMIRTSFNNAKLTIPELIFNFMKKKNVTISSETYNEMLTGYIKLDFSRAIELFNNEIKPQFGKNTELNQTILYNTMIGAYIKMFYGMEKAKALLNDMKQNGIKITAFTYNKFICEYFESEKYEEVLKYLKEMEITNCPPDEETISLFIKVLLEKKNVELAKIYFNEFFTNPALNITYAPYDIMINGYFDCDYPLLAVRLFKTVPIRSFKMKQKLVTIMIKRGFQFSAGEEYVNEIKQNKMIMSEVAYNAVINRYLRYGIFSNAEELFNNLRKFDFDFNGPIHASMAVGYFEAEKPEEGLAIFNEMIQKNFTSHFTPRIFVCLVKFYVQQRNITKALEVLEDMEKKYHLKPWSITFAPIIDYYAKLGNMPEAEKCKELSKKKSGHVHVKSYQALIWGYKTTRNYKKAKEMSQEKSDVGFKNLHKPNFFYPNLAKIKYW